MYCIVKFWSWFSVTHFYSYCILLQQWFLVVQLVALLTCSSRTLFPFWAQVTVCFFSLSPHGFHTTFQDFASRWIGCLIAPRCLCSCIVPSVPEIGSRSTVTLTRIMQLLWMNECLLIIFLGISEKGQHSQYVEEYTICILIYQN